MKFNKLYNEIMNEYYDDDYSKDVEYEKGTLASSSYSMDDIDGEIFGMPNNFYAIEIKAELSMVDDSDYSREGYGSKIYPENIEDVVEFKIIEYDQSGEFSRNEQQIETESPELYEKILQYAKTKVIEEYEPS